MPRDGSGVYTRPPGTNAVSQGTASSSAYNTWVADVEFDLNYPRPISAGGTGANNVADALTNLGVPAAIQANVGFLSFISNTQIKFHPYGGDQVKINGKVYRIPSGGVVAGTNNVYIDGAISPSGLVIGTTYFVYLFDNNGTLTIDFSVTGPNISVLSGNAGVWKKIGDDTRSLIGMVRMSGSGFINNKASRYVRSWFNRQGENLELGANWLAQRSVVGSLVPVEIAAEIRLSYLIWQGENLTLHFMCPTSNDIASMFSWTAISIDGVIGFTGLTAPYNAIRSPPGLPGTWFPNSFSITNSNAGADGWHQASVWGWGDIAGGTTYYGLTGSSTFGILNGCIHV